LALRHLKPSKSMPIRRLPFGVADNTAEVENTAMVTATVSSGLEVLYTRDQIAKRVAEMGEQISKDFAGQRVLLIGVLKGATIFLSDLARCITLDATFDFLSTSSYGKGHQQSGEVRLLKDVDHSVEGQNIILVEDILDTGVTLSYLRRVLNAHQPGTLKIAALLDKPARRIQKIEGDYIGFTIPNKFVVGYGLDYAERYRNLPDICVIPPTALGDE
jgi:hypoxanthine phosphoribosyltransferase